jgi:hypothetical protein
MTSMLWLRLDTETTRTTKMTESTFSELVEAIDFNLKGLESVGDLYTETTIQNLRNIVYCLDRIEFLTKELVEKVETQISELVE